MPKNNPFIYPSFSKDVQHEVEIVIKINRLGKHIEEKFSHKYYNEIAIGVDFTARDIQQECKEKGLPWEKAKAFDGAAPTSKFIPIRQFEDINNLNFSADDVINIDDAFLSVDSMLFATTTTGGLNQINFAFGDVTDFTPSFTVNIDTTDTVVVADVAAAADSAAALAVLNAAWGSEWLV